MYVFIYLDIYLFLVLCRTNAFTLGVIIVYLPENRNSVLTSSIQ